MTRVDELSAQLKDERLKSLELEQRLQGMNITKAQMEQVKQFYLHLLSVQRLPLWSPHCVLLSYSCRTGSVSWSRRMTC